MRGLCHRNRKLTRFSGVARYKGKIVIKNSCSLHRCDFNCAWVLVEVESRYMILVELLPYRINLGAGNDAMCRYMHYFNS